MAEIKGNEFPSNARGQRRDTVGIEEKKPLEKIVTGNVIQKKPGFFKSISNNVFADDTKSVGNYILYDILLPAAKSMISEMIGGGIEMLLFGERRGGKNIRREGGRSVTSYGEYYNDNRNTRFREPERDRGRELSRTSRSRHDFDEIIIPSRGEAERVLDKLVELTIDYKEATVADLYELTGIEAAFTDRKYGWRSLRYATIVRAKTGYIIDLPPTELLDQEVIIMANKDAIDKFNYIQMEILNIGWDGILKKYHPDINESHPHALAIFILYKEVYENMKQRMIVKEDSP